MTDERPILKLKLSRPRQERAATRLKGFRAKPLTTKSARNKPLASKAAKQEPPVPKAELHAKLLAELRSTAPALWDAAHPLPLAVGFHKQLQPFGEALGLSRTAVRGFLTAWTTNVAYLVALSRPGATRFNLDGSCAGEVSEKHRLRAQQRLQQRADAAASEEERAPDASSRSA